MLEPPWLEGLVRFLTHPLVSPLLLSLAVLGVAFELKAGAFGLGGLVSLARATSRAWRAGRRRSSW